MMLYVCRLCSASDLVKVEVIKIFGKEGLERNLPWKLNTLPYISIEQDDPLSNYACMRCIKQLDRVLAFHERCRQTQMVLWKEFIMSFKERAPRQRNGMRMQDLRQMEGLVKKAVSLGVDVGHLQSCLWHSLEDLCWKRPIACFAMLRQLASRSAVRLERCPKPITPSSTIDEIEDALPVFHISRTVAHRESGSSADSDDEVLQTLARSLVDTGEDSNMQHSDRIAGNKCMGQSGNNVVMAEDKGDRNILQANNKDDTDTVNMAVSNVQGDSGELGYSEDEAMSNSKIESTEFVDVGLINDNMVIVDSEVKIKEEMEEPMLELEEPPTLLHERQDVGQLVSRLVDDVIAPHGQQTCQASRNKSILNPPINTSTCIKQEEKDGDALPNNSLLDLVLYCNSNDYKRNRSIKHSIRGSALAQLLQQDSNTPTNESMVLDQSKPPGEVSPASQYKVNCSVACQTSLERRDEDIHEKTNTPISTTKSIQVSVPQTKEQRRTYSRKNQCVNDVHTAQEPCSSLPADTTTHHLPNMRQLPVSRVQPLSTSVPGTPKENSQAQQNLEDQLLGAQPPPNQVVSNLFHSPQAAAVVYPGRQQFDDTGMHNIVQYSHGDMITPVVGMQNHTESVGAVFDIHHPSTRFQQTVSNSQPSISVVNHSSFTNVPTLPSIKQTCIQPVVSNSQSSISVVNHSSLENVPVFPSIQQPLANNSYQTIPLMNHSLLTNMQPTTSLQPVVSNSQSSISVVNRSSLENVPVFCSIQQPIAGFEHANNSHQTIPIINHSLLTNVQPFPSILQPSTNFQPVGQVQTAVSVIKNSSLTNVQATPCIQPPASSFEHIACISQPAISLAKHSSHAQAVTGSQQPATSFQNNGHNSQPAIAFVKHSTLTNMQAVPDTQQPTTSFQNFTSNSQPAVAVVKHSTLTNMQAVPDTRQPTTSFQNFTSNSQPAIAVVKHSALTNVQAATGTEPPAVSFQNVSSSSSSSNSSNYSQPAIAVPDTRQPATSFQNVSSSNSQPRIAVAKHSTLANVQVVRGIQQAATSFQNVSSYSHSAIAAEKHSTLANVHTVPGTTQSATSFQNISRRSQSSTSIPVAKHSSLANVQAVSGTQQPATSFQTISNCSQPPIAVVKRPTHTNVQVVTSIQRPITTSGKVVTNPQPLISVKDFSRLNAISASSDRYSENRNQSVVNATQHIPQSAVKRAYDAVVNHQSTGTHSKQLRLVEGTSAGSKHQVETTSATSCGTSAPQEQSIQSYSLSLEAWASLQDDSNTTHMDTFLLKQISGDEASNQSRISAPEESLKMTGNQRSIVDIDSFLDYLQVVGKKYVCLLCEGYMNRAEYCVKHIQSHVADSHFYCSVCKSEVPASRFVKSHLQRCLKGIVRQVSGTMLKCLLCSVEFTQEESLRYHYRRHTTPHCNYKYSYLCHPCGKAFVLRSDYLAHKLKVHGLDEGLEKASCRFMCNNCKTFFFAKDALDKHLATQCSQDMDNDCQIIE